MFRYGKNSLYDRCGAIDIPFDSSITPESTGKFATICGEQLPIINYKFQSGVVFTRNLCLKTFLGYIPIENIETFYDIFDKSKYLQDETEWIKSYNDELASDTEKEKVRTLSLTLGKHWKNEK